MKITISKSQWEKIGKKAGWMKKANVVYKGTPCPKCGFEEHYILNPSMPIINQCIKCRHKWNPDNEKWNPASGNPDYNLETYFSEMGFSESDKAGWYERHAK
jgi:hypothetical protein